MSNGKIAGIAIGTLAIGIAIGFIIPADSGIEKTPPAPMIFALDIKKNFRQS